MTTTSSRTIDAEDFNDLFDVSRTALRLEALPAYAVGGAEQERLAAYRRGLPRPLRNVRTDPWLARIAYGVSSGRQEWIRLRVVDDPLTEYQRYQLASYRESQTVGETVLIAKRRDVGAVGPDFWLFDGTRVVLMHYRPDGSVDRREYTRDPDVVRRCVARGDAVAAVAIPLNEFLVGVGE